jgi:hypothetical protein
VGSGCFLPVTHKRELIFRWGMVSCYTTFTHVAHNCAIMAVNMGDEVTGLARYAGCATIDWWGKTLCRCAVLQGMEGHSRRP